MGRVHRFSDNRFLGLRDEMRFYDCDDEDQFVTLQGRIDGEDLAGRLLVATFAPDTAVEARNRGFRTR